MPKMNPFLYEDYQGGPTLTLLNVLSLLGVPYILNVLNVLNVLNMPKDALLACWALFNLLFGQLEVTDVDYTALLHFANLQTA